MEHRQQETDSLLQQIDVLNSKKQQSNSLKNIITTITSVTQNISIKKTKLQELEIYFKKEFPNICPLCGTNIKHTHGSIS